MRKYPKNCQDAAEGTQTAGMSKNMVWPYEYQAKEVDFVFGETDTANSWQERECYFPVWTKIICKKVEPLQFLWLKTMTSLQVSRPCTIWGGTFLLYHKYFHMQTWHLYFQVTPNERQTPSVVKTAPIYLLWSDDTAHMLNSISYMFVFILSPSPCIYFSICQKYHILSCLLLLLFSRGEKERLKTNPKTETSVLLVFTLSSLKRSVGTVIKSFSTIIPVIGLYQ